MLSTHAVTAAQAVNLFASIRVPLMPRTYPSGVTIIQSAAHSDAEVGMLSCC